MKRHRMAIPVLAAALHLFALSASAQPAKADSPAEQPAAKTAEPSDAKDKSGPAVIPALPPPPKPSCKPGKFKCNENKVDAMQCMAATPSSKEGPDAEVKWRVIYPCPFGCVEGESDTVKPTCAKLTKKKKPSPAKN
jgi:hypothetical protein